MVPVAVTTPESGLEVSIQSVDEMDRYNNVSSLQEVLIIDKIKKDRAI
jgi:hypothetical protein